MKGDVGQAGTDGDSGGPLVVMTNDQSFPYYAVGVNSWSNYDGVQVGDLVMFFTIHARIDSVRSWIYEQMDPIELRIANEDLSTNNLGGTLRIDNFIPEISSGDTLDIPKSNTFTFRTDEQIQSNKQHWMWNETSTQYFLHHKNSFIINSDELAIFKATNNIDFASSITQPSDLILFKDPWYTDENNYQPDSLFELNDIAPNDNYDVFLNQNPEYQHDDPIYQLCAKEYFADTLSIFEFDYWGGTSVDYDTTTNLCAEVVFQTNTWSSLFLCVKTPQG